MKKMVAIVLALVLVLRRKRGWVFGIVLSVIYLLCCGVGSYYLYHTNQAVDEILILFLCPFLGSMAAFPIFFHPRIPPSLLHYIPYRGILQGKIRQFLSDFL